MDEIGVGDRVRSFDFECRDAAGPAACYVEGVVASRLEAMGCDRYEIVVDRRVFAGEELDLDGLGENPLKVYPPVNGTPALFGGTTNYVERI